MTPRVGGSTLGLLTAFGFYAIGLANFLQLPTSGGFLSSPLLLERWFAFFVYVPLIQLPLATVYLFLATDRPREAGVTSGTHPRAVGPTRVVGLFAVLAVVVAGLWVYAQQFYPAGLGSLAWLADAFLWEGGWDLLFRVYLIYFPVVVAGHLTVRAVRGGPGRDSRPPGSVPPEPPTATPEEDSADADTSSPERERPGTGSGAAATSTPSAADGQRAPPSTGVSHPPVGPAAPPTALRRRVDAVTLPARVPYWGVVALVGLALALGHTAGDLDSGIAVAGLILTLYEMQPQREPD